jgi:SAM-dependent methyltransferase
MRARLPMPLTRELHAMTPDLPGELFDDEFDCACERLDRFIGALVRSLARDLDLVGRRLPTTAELTAARGWSADGQLAVEWLLETLELYGHADRTDAGWEVAAPLDGDSPEEIRAEAVAAMPATEPAYRVLELSAAALPSVLSGKTRGEDAIFGPATLGLWFDYCSNSNPHYALNNRLFALAASRAASHGARVFEVGGGGGSAAQALLAELTVAGKPPAHYTFTDLHPAFLRRGGRTVQAALPSGCGLATRLYDVNLNPASQGVAPGQFDLVVAVNTLHLAQDPVDALAHLRMLLAPGGALVLGELVRPSPLAPVHLELPFAMLEAYRRAPLAEGIRQRPGFMSFTGWRQALQQAGFGGISLLPNELERCAEVYPGYYCAAITAR